MSFARGFKAYCERAVATLRSELGVGAIEPIDMHALAEHLLIPVQSLLEVLTLSGTPRTDPLVEQIYGSVSAMTTFEGTLRSIIYNEEHSPLRHRSNMAHELAHALLQHPPDNCGLAPEQVKLHEAEAAHFGGVLMLSSQQAQQIALQRLSAEEASSRFHVSLEMLRYRLNVTGAKRVASRKAHWFSLPSIPA